MHIRQPKLAAATFALLALLAPTASRAQRVLGPGEDAWTLPAGVVRIGVAPRFFGASETFGADGRTALGAPYSGLLGTSTFSSLHDLEQSIAALTGLSTFRVTLGTARANLRQSRAAIPLDVSAGITSRVTLRVSAPFFTGEYEAQWLLDSTGATVGANPELLASSPLAGNADLVGGLDSAAAQLERLADGCIANMASDPRCGQITAEITQVRALIAQSRGASDAIAQTYGGRTSGVPSLFVPRDGGAAHTAIATLIAGLRSGFDVYGVGSVAEGAAPAGASAAPTLGELRALLADSAYGYVLGPFSRRYAQGVGDIDLGVTLMLFDGLRSNNPWNVDSAPPRFSLRQSVGFTYRLGTGTGPDPDDPFKMPTGDGQNDLEFTSTTDVVLSRRLWSTLLVRWTMQQPFDAIARIPDASGSPFVPLQRRRQATTTLGDRIEIQVAPRWVVNEYMAFGARWRFTQQEGTRIDELAPFTDAIPLSYAGPSMSAHEAGIGFTWSSVAAWRRGKAKWPIEVQWDRSVVVAGEGGVVRFSADRISVRAYARLWGK